MKEVWTKWNPVEGIKAHYYIISISDNAEGFEVILQTSNDSEKTMRIYFKNSVEAYRRTDESYMGGVIGPMADEYGREFALWPLFKIENSEYLRWFFKTSIGMAEIRGWKFTHFAIIAIDSVLDIIAATEPSVEFIDYK